MGSLPGAFQERQDRRHLHHALLVDSTTQAAESCCHADRQIQKLCQPRRMRAGTVRTISLLFHTSPPSPRLPSQPLPLQIPFRKNTGKMVHVEPQYQLPRDFEGFGYESHDCQWPNGARIAISFVLNYVSTLADTAVLIRSRRPATTNRLLIRLQDTMPPCGGILRPSNRPRRCPSALFFTIPLHRHSH